MSEKQWRKCGEQCEKHVTDIEIYTSIEQPGTGFRVYDGDPCRCGDGCRGYAAVYSYDDRDDVHIRWDESTDVCRHGGLGRKCDVCRLEAENAALKAEIERMKVFQDVDMVEIERLKKLADDRLKQRWDEADSYRKEVSKLKADVARLKKFVERTANQQSTEEVGQDVWEVADLETAYEYIVLGARATLKEAGDE